MVSLRAECSAERLVYSMVVSKALKTADLSEILMADWMADCMADWTAAPRVGTMVLETVV